MNRDGLTRAATSAHTECAVSDASGTGRRKPVSTKAHKRQSRALFFCPAIIYGGWYGAGSRLAGSFVPVFLPPYQSPPIPAVGSGTVAPKPAKEPTP